MGACYKCGEPWLDEGELPADATCNRCSSWLHCCANCTHYDEYSKKKCMEPQAEFVFDRHGRNECPHFKFRQIIRGEDRRDKKKKLSPRAEQHQRASEARDKLDSLFR